MVAHIRHVYTDYDRLLKTTSFHEARSHVEEPTLARLVAWRGDDENGKTVLEDVFREVIVISDDEDSDAEGDDPLSAGRSPSVEIVSSNVLHGELQTRPVNYASQRLHESLQDSSDDDAPSGFRVVPHIARRDKVDRRGFSRYQAWDRAINRYRKETNETERKRHRPADYQKVLHSTEMPAHGAFKPTTEQAGFHNMARRRASVASFTDSGHDNAGSSRRNDIATPNPIIERRVSVRGTSVLALNHTHSQPQTQETNNNFILTFNEPFELHPPFEPPRPRSRAIIPLPEVPLQRVPLLPHKKHLLQHADTADAPNFVSSIRENLCGSENYSGRQFAAPIPFHSRVRLSPQDRALPSIEGPQVPPLERGRPGNDQLNHLAERVSNGISRHSVAPYRLPHGDIPPQVDDNNPRFPAPKRRRAAQYESIRDDSRTFAHHEPVKPIPVEARTDAFAANPIVPPGYTSTRPWPAQDNVHSRRNYVVSVRPRYSAGHQREAFPNPPSYSTHFTPELAGPSGQRYIDHTHTQHSHNLEPRLITHRKGPTQSHKFPSTNYAMPLNDTFGHSHPVDSSDLGTRRVCQKRCEYTAHSLNATGAAEFSVPSGHSMANDRVPGSNDAPRRRALYAEDFVRPVGLHDADPLDSTRYPRFQTKRAMEGPARPLKVYDQTKNELPGNITLTARHSRPLFDPRAVYPTDNVDYRQDTTYNNGRLPHSSTATAQLESQRQSPIRYGCAADSHQGN